MQPHRQRQANKAMPLIIMPNGRRHNIFNHNRIRTIRFRTRSSSSSNWERQTLIMSRRCLRSSASISIIYSARQSVCSIRLPSLTRQSYMTRIWPVRLSFVSPTGFLYCLWAKFNSATYTASLHWAAWACTVCWISCLTRVWVRYALEARWAIVFCLWSYFPSSEV